MKYVRQRIILLVIVAVIFWICIFMTFHATSVKISRELRYVGRTYTSTSLDSNLSSLYSDNHTTVFPREQSGVPEDEERTTFADKLYVTRSVKKLRTRHKHSSYGHCQSDDMLHLNSENITAPNYFSDTFTVSKYPFSSWLKHKDVYCNTTIIIYNNMFGLVQDMKINPAERHNVDHLAKGGEGVEDVKDQNIDKEDYEFKTGFYEVVCNDTKALETFSNNRYDKLRQVRMVNNMDKKKYKVEEKFTIALARGDYANLWNHMFELYGVFVMMMVFHKQPEDVSILFLDGHPSCLLDRNWEHIFGPVKRVGHFESPVVYHNFVWGLSEKQIPLSKWENSACPYVEEFRDFVLSQYGINANAKGLNCKKMTFTFIVRRNQVYHPRNLEGNVERKIFNELEVIETLMDHFPGVCVQALLMESIPMSAQLEIISETDVLIGMHGAGMMHTTFLPPHAGVVELFPRNWRKSRIHSIMYEILALRWRGLQYRSWENPNPKRDFSDKVTIVDANKVYEEVKQDGNKMC